MDLKTDYKNDKYAGRRKYDMIKNSDGTVSLDDKTVYQTEGDIFNADDINSTNNRVNGIASSMNSEIEKTKRLYIPHYVLIPSSGWGDTQPYTQRVTVDGVTDSDSPIVAQYLPDALSIEDIKLQSKAYGNLDRITTTLGGIELFCYSKRPVTDFWIGLKGVGSNG